MKSESSRVFIEKKKEKTGQGLGKRRVEEKRRNGIIIIIIIIIIIY